MAIGEESAVDGVHIWTDSESLRRTALVYGGDSSKDSGPAIVLGALRLAPRSSGSSVWVLKGAGPVRAVKIVAIPACSFRTRGRTLKVEKLDDAGQARRVVTGVRVGPRTSVSGQHVRERQSVVGPNGCEVPLDVSAATRRRHRRGRVVARGPRLGGLLGGRGPRGRIGVDAGALDEHGARVRGVHRARVPDGCAGRAVPVAQRVQLDADAGHGRQHAPRLIALMSERHRICVRPRGAGARGRV